MAACGAPKMGLFQADASQAQQQPGTRWSNAQEELGMAEELLQLLRSGGSGWWS